ncbi:trypsin-like serine protease, partial [Streptomyces roseifaciens]
MLVSTVAVSVLNGTQAGAVVGEKDKDGSYAFTAKLDIGDGQRGCSAALVAPQWLITAASCFADDPAQSYKVAPGAPKLPAKAVIGRTDLTPNGGSEAQVVELVPRDDRDLVMAKLAKPVTGTVPVGLGTQAPVVGEDVWLTGHGRTKDEWVPDLVHYGQFTVDKAENTTFNLASKSSGATACKGDTGGPALRNAGGRYELVGVNGRSWQGGCLGSDPKETRTGAVGTRVDDIVGWVREQVDRKEPASEAPVDTDIDFDGDGKADYLVVEDNGSVHAWLNRGGDTRGGWSDYGIVAKGAGAPGSKVRFADINADGKADYLIVEDNGAVRAFINDGGDTRGGWTNYGTIAKGAGAPGTKVRFADINADHKADYLIVEDNGAVRAFINDGGDTRGGWTNYGT